MSIDERCERRGGRTGAPRPEGPVSVRAQGQPRRTRVSPERRPASTIAVAVLAASVAAIGGCASWRYSRMDPPDGARALGVEFGSAREDAWRVLREEGIAVSEVAGDRDALLAERCPQAPVKAPCRLLFGTQGLYAVQVEVPASETGALSHAVEDALGAADDETEGTPVERALAIPIASWHRPGWTVGVSRAGARVAVLRIEYDPAAPPVVAGVPLGRLREDIERVLDAQGATMVQRDERETTYLGCPEGAGEALSCVVHFRRGRGAAVTEIHPSAPDEKGALAAWRLLARRFEREIGRAPATQCPDAGPDRVEGDCTATWSSDRLVVVVGAHRNAGREHRGAISVYTAFTYPPLSPGDEEEAASTEIQ